MEKISIRVLLKDQYKKKIKKFKLFKILLNLKEVLIMMILLLKLVQQNSRIFSDNIFNQIVAFNKINFFINNN